MVTKYLTPEQFDLINRALRDNIDLIYSVFNVPYSMGNKICYSPCFIHGGDNASALNLYHNADFKLHYKCRSHGCEEEFGNSIINMIRGGLSHLKYGWEKPGDRKVSFKETIAFICEHWHVDIKNVEKKASHIDYVTAALVSVLDVDLPIGKFDPAAYRRAVDIPAAYFVRRGFSPEILKKHDVGTCTAPKRQMTGRAVVPIFDHTGEKILGCSGRSLYESCPQCGWYHPPGKCFYVPKWRNTTNLPKEKVLYNYSWAKKHIEKTSVAVIVESPGNVWRLEEAGIFNCVALLGTTMSYEQKYLLNMAGAMNLIFIMDNDTNNAGCIAARKLIDMCRREYNTTSLSTFNKNDIGEMTVEEVRKEILPHVSCC